MRQLAKKLTASAQTQYDAVQHILSWIVDHIDYVQQPNRYDARFAMKTGKGNCQNYSHVAAALMRAVGIPVRIVNGVTSREPFDMKVRGGVMTMRMGQGRHSWIEVYFPSFGWIPFDPQQMQLFVSNRFIRLEIGLDNNECINDGTVFWTRHPGSRGTPTVKENVYTIFSSDRVRIDAEKESYGPRKMLFTPPVDLFVTQFAFEESGSKPVSSAPIDLAQFRYDKQTEFGNLNFPQGVNFLDVQMPVEENEDGTLMMRKNFLVETSEYVTTEGRKYTQTFIVEDPLKLEKIGLALHKFGGEGQLWLELFEDDGNGKPGNPLGTSDLLPLSRMSQRAGYDWVDFDFYKEGLILGPGRYWIALGYTGSPIISWFFTYGKPVGPIDGTRYNTLFDETWSHNLAFEFNYRIIGKIGR
jgi:hypothetical protein